MSFPVFSNVVGNVVRGFHHVEQGQKINEQSATDTGVQATMLSLQATMLVRIDPDMAIYTRHMIHVAAAIFDSGVLYGMTQQIRIAMKVPMQEVALMRIPDRGIQKVLEEQIIDC